MFFKKKKDKSLSVKPNLDLVRIEFELHFICHVLSLSVQKEELELKKAEAINKNDFLAKIRKIAKSDEKLESSINDTNDALNKIIKEANDAGFNDFSEQRRLELINEFSKNDVCYERRIIFALKYAYSLDELVSKSTRQNIFKTLSNELGFPSENALEELHSSFKKNYLELGKDKEQNKQNAINNGLIAGLIVGGLATFTLIPVFSVIGLKVGGAISASLLTSTVIATTVGGSVGAVLYGFNNVKDDKALINELSNLLPSDLINFLALNLTIINYMLKWGNDKENASLKLRINTLVNLDHEISVRFFNSEITQINEEKKSLLSRGDLLLVKIISQAY